MSSVISHHLSNEVVPVGNCVVENFVLEFGFLLFQKIVQLHVCFNIKLISEGGHQRGTSDMFLDKQIKAVVIVIKMNCEVSFCSVEFSPVFLP